MKDFERIISDAMLAFADCNNVPHEEGLELEDIYLDADDQWPEDSQGEEDWG
jgi:hypothetical protein